MTTLENLRAASVKSQEIVSLYLAKSEGEPDVIAERVKELSELKKDELIKLVIGLEKPKTERAFKVEDIVQSLLEEPECAIFTYEQIAALVQQALPGAKTSAKSVASYASKRKEDWDIIAREKLKLTAADLLDAANAS